VSFDGAVMVLDAVKGIEEQTGFDVSLQETAICIVDKDGIVVHEEGDGAADLG
jgi:hypothetical protein